MSQREEAAVSRRLAGQLDSARAALLVVDMQNDFCDGGGALAKRGGDVGPTQAMLPKLLRLIGLARAAKLPIIYTANAHDAWTNSAAWQQRQGGEGLALCRTGS